MTVLTRRKSTAVLPWIIGGILLLGTGAWFGVPYIMNTVGNPEQKETRTIESWLAASATMLPLENAEGAQFASLLKKADGQALLVLNQQAEDGKAYQAWKVKGDDITSLGVVGLRTLQMDTTGLDAVLVSLEPQSGSDAPTQILGDVQLK
ncbi:anti-sigma factor domain-containing protein [Deinococcus cellulosilyticus]|uniref:Anti-sigma K factor RskA C-terminal domain-containing protein n=1 Tax=Deinococcus cellulosilyticus (strain DSM 18568 / NBRC 106333 / KACC 11606 / 5516J-15) TaxID=1223518 RepID=A0A511N6F1_DEIC1|nr:anti-sigma factor [Deinococcus cellulosilyticus]GEM48423.1 hypothetical protein DC3_40580 [Deinococcus cellulosilyticus NBRC 106333 = KACC 11606]